MDVPKASTNPSEMLSAPEQVEVAQPNKLENEVETRQGYRSLDPSGKSGYGAEQSRDQDGGKYQEGARYAQPNTTRINNPSSPPSFPPPNINQSLPDPNLNESNHYYLSDNYPVNNNNYNASTSSSPVPNVNGIRNDTTKSINDGINRSINDNKPLENLKANGNLKVNENLTANNEPIDTRSQSIHKPQENITRSIPQEKARAIPTTDQSRAIPTTDQSRSAPIEKSRPTTKNQTNGPQDSIKEPAKINENNIKIGKSIDNSSSNVTIQNNSTVGSTARASNNNLAPSKTVDSVAQSTKSNASKQIQTLEPSEDLDVSNIKTKPPPRQPGQPTYRGWKEVGRWEENDTLTADDETVDLLSKASLFDNYIPAALVGDWYHNVALLIGGGILSWLVGYFRFSLGPVFFVVIFFALVYRTSIRKYRISLREQAQREFSIKTIETDYETMDWLNNFLEKFWFFLEPSIAQIVCDQANPILASSPAPAFIKKLWIDSFSAGSKPPRIDQVKTLSGTHDDIVVMDWGFSFTPNSVVDANNKQVKNKVNQKVVVKLELFGVTLPVTVSNVAVKGMARVRMRMMSSFPHIETINVSFLQPPIYDFKTTFFGDTGFNWEVLAFPGLYPLINEMIVKYVGPILFAPLSFQLNVQQLLAGNALDSAIGVLAITVNSARGLKGFNALGNTLDPYLTFSFTKHDILAKTSVKDDTSKPVWNETIYIPIKSLSEPLNIAGIDFNDFRKDKQFGSIKLDLDMLVDNPKQPNLHLPFLRNNRPVGELQFGLHFMPTIEAIRQADGAVTPPPELNTGIARIAVVEARHLNPGSEKAVTSYVEILYNKEKVKTSALQKNTNSPGWNAVQEQIVGNRARSKVKIILRNKDDKIIGQVYKSLNEFIDASAVDQTWFPLAKGGEVRVETQWKPVELVDASGAGGYTPPIGAVRISIEKAEDLRNLETIGKIDPYARILVNGFERARTLTVDSNLNPTWNEIHYVTVTSANQKLTIDVMDYESHSPDRTLGACDFKLSEIINKDEAGRYIEHIDTQKREAKLLHKKGTKGSVTFQVSFFPALPVMTLEEIKEEEEDKRQAIEAKKKKEEAEKKDEKKADKPKVEEKDATEIEEGVDSTDQKMKLDLDQLLEYQSGVFTFEIIELDLPKDDVYLQVFFDSYGEHNFVTQKLTKKGIVKLGVTGDAVVKQLDWSTVVFRLTTKKNNNRAEKCISEMNIPTLQILKNSFTEPDTITLRGASETKVKLQAGWIPLIYENGIPPQDSYENSGKLTVYIDKAENLPAADSNGYSDPFVELYLNSNEEPFFKSKKQKKTLNPTFHETFEVSLANKYDSEIRIECYDWDMAGDNDHLGTGYIKLSEFDTKEKTVEVKTPLIAQDGSDAGVVYFTLKFKPEFVMNIKPATQTGLGDAFHAVGTVGSTGKGAVKSVGKLGLGGVGKGAKLLKKGLSLGKSSD